MSCIICAAAASTDGSNVTTSAVDTTGVNLLVAIVCSYQSNPAPTFSDSKSNTWTGLTEQAVSSNSRIRIYYCYNPTVGSGHTFTLSSASLVAPSIHILGFDNAASSPFDAENGATGTTVATLNSGAVSPSEDNEIIVTGISVSALLFDFPLQCNEWVVGGYQQQTGGLVYGQTSQFPLASGKHFTTAAAYAIQGPKASTSATWQWSSGSGANPCVVIACFKTTTTGGGGETSHAFCG